MQAVLEYHSFSAGAGVKCLAPLDSSSEICPEIQISIPHGRVTHLLLLTFRLPKMNGTHLHKSNFLFTTALPLLLIKIQHQFQYFF